MAQYPVLGFVKHNGEKFESGDVIDLQPKEAKPLIKLGTIAAKPLKSNNKKDNGQDDGKTNPDNSNNKDDDKTDPDNQKDQNDQNE